MLKVHVRAPYLLNLACGELLRCYGEQHGYADIIHMSDYVAGTGSSKHIAYAASKAGSGQPDFIICQQVRPIGQGEQHCSGAVNV